MAKYRGRGPHFDPNMDPDLLASMEAAARGWESPYEVALSSGYRKGPRQHGKGEAIDIRLYDPKTGGELDRYQRGAQVEPFQQFANYWYGTLTPEQQAKARWGGYFGDPSDPTYGTNYGEQDYMHFDFGRTPTLGMLAGDWATGFKPEAMQKLGLSGAGGIGQMVAQAKAAGYSDDQIKAAFLSSVAGTESPGYDVLYGGGKFTDYSQHPNRMIPVMSGPNKGDYSTAAGKYQFLKGTWDPIQKALGLKDFSPASQDAAAWYLADTEFKRLTGGSLMEALQSGDPGRINAAAQVLNKQWTSLPGGIEQNKRYAGGDHTFANAFQQALGAPQASTSAIAGTGGLGGSLGSAASSALASAAGQDKSRKEKLGKMLEMATAGFSGTPQFSGAADLPPQPAAARVDQPAVPVIDPQQTAMHRQELAAILARLNQGSLI